jgi:hypothetical protein
MGTITIDVSTSTTLEVTTMTPTITSTLHRHRKGRIKFSGKLLWGHLAVAISRRKKDQKFSGAP